MYYHCYADDTQVYLIINPKDSWDDIENRLERCLSDMQDWMQNNILKLNQDKSELIIFTPKRMANEFTGRKLAFGGSVIKDACRTLVRSLATSRLDYGNALFFALNATSLQKLQKVQNTAARLVTRLRKHEHITPILITLHWLPVAYRAQYKILLYTFKALQKLAPKYIQELIQVYRPQSLLRSGDSLSLVKPRTRSKMYGDRRFDVSSATLWNCLPLDLRKEQSLEVFK
ncbi:uncharacterized protein LOC134244660 [Saccostrea cucullata]|uniref:uncharacterized protein LOC134244660 n=1 Tax=Saccostrea cuccullata TaxID=36930 RepID=UPI002ED45C1A